MLVGTPLGNLGDAPPRLVHELTTADVVAAEDTRTLHRLLSGLGIRTLNPPLSYHEHNEVARTADLLGRLQAGSRVVLVTDAGMPSISDPGYRLVQACANVGVTVTAVPGPSAVTVALVLSGLATQRFCFEGFLPRSGSARTALIAALVSEPRTIVFFESPHRLAKTLSDLAVALGPGRPAAVCRELTKLHEQVRRGTLTELAQWAGPGVRGECTVVVGGAPPTTPAAADPAAWVSAVAELEATGITRRDAIAEVAVRQGAPRRAVYDAVHGVRTAQRT